MLVDNPTVHPVDPKSTTDLAEEWDRIAHVRAGELSGGLDLSYQHVLMPTVEELMGPAAGRLLDVGCGTGELTRRLSLRAEQVVAIDPSARSIEEARRRSQNIAHIEWRSKSIEDFVRVWRGYQFDVTVANMSLMDAADLNSVLAAVGEILKSGGLFVWTITHPWFWPTYWGYEGAPWFDYNRETFIEAEFRITRHASGLNTTHIHRPLSTYLNSMISHGLAPESLVEPVPDAEAMQRYPEVWKYPRFLGGRCRRL